MENKMETSMLTDLQSMLPKRSNNWRSVLDETTWSKDTQEEDSRQKRYDKSGGGIEL